ncbi:hypothetical protein C2U51_00640 [Enterobacteriaceae bacterium ENNIH1]|nr:hypothetical protein C2U51_00640 [Enterobacteriaceae bacterium ENNIH1]
MMNPVPWLQMTNMISYQGLVRTFLSDFTSLGGLFSPFLSVMIFIGLSSILIGIIGVYAVGKVYCALTQVKHD